MEKVVLNPEIEMILDPKPDQRCSFCYSAVNNPLRYGDMFKYKHLMAHYFCVLMSSQLQQKGADDEGFFGFLIEDLDKELERAKTVKCCFCKRGGATAQCNAKVKHKQKCQHTFHLTCGVTKGTLHYFFGKFQSLCHVHRRAQKVPPEFIKDSAVQCLICFDFIQDVNSSFTSLWAPCCKKYYFHKDCVQRLAYSSGEYHFRCPLCNNPDKFKQAMLRCGIYLPIRDAEWEREPNAFSELYTEHNQCDVETCLCPHVGKEGNKRLYNSGAWDLIRCASCGSEGTHRPCSGLSLSGDVSWDCASCRQVFKRREQGTEAAEEEVQKTIEADTCCAFFCLCNKGRDYQTDKGMYRTTYCSDCELSWIHARCRTVETNGEDKGSHWTCVGCQNSDSEEPEDSPSTSRGTRPPSASDQAATEAKTKKQVSTPCQVVLDAMSGHYFYRTISHLLSRNAYVKALSRARTRGIYVKKSTILQKRTSGVLGERNDVSVNGNLVVNELEVRGSEVNDTFVEDLGKLNETSAVGDSTFFNDTTYDEQEIESNSMLTLNDTDVGKREFGTNSRSMRLLNITPSKAETAPIGVFKGTPSKRLVGRIDVVSKTPTKFDESCLNDSELCLSAGKDRTSMSKADIEDRDKVVDRELSYSDGDVDVETVDDIDQVEVGQHGVGANTTRRKILSDSIGLELLDGTDCPEHVEPEGTKINGDSERVGGDKLGTGTVASDKTLGNDITAVTDSVVKDNMPVNLIDALTDPVIRDKTPANPTTANTDPVSDNALVDDINAVTALVDDDDDTFVNPMSVGATSMMVYSESEVTADESADESIVNTSYRAIKRVIGVFFGESPRSDAEIEGRNDVDLEVNNGECGQREEISTKPSQSSGMCEDFNSVEHGKSVEVGQPHVSAIGGHVQDILVNDKENGNDSIQSNTETSYTVISNSETCNIVSSNSETSNIVSSNSETSNIVSSNSETSNTVSSNSELSDSGISEMKDEVDEGLDSIDREADGTKVNTCEVNNRESELGMEVDQLTHVCDLSHGEVNDLRSIEDGCLKSIENNIEVRKESDEVMKTESDSNVMDNNDNALNNCNRDGSIKLAHAKGVNNGGSARKSISRRNFFSMRRHSRRKSRPTCVVHLNDSPGIANSGRDDKEDNCQNSENSTDNKAAKENSPVKRVLRVTKSESSCDSMILIRYETELMPSEQHQTEEKEIVSENLSTESKLNEPGENSVKQDSVVEEVNSTRKTTRNKVNAIDKNGDIPETVKSKRKSTRNKFKLSFENGGETEIVLKEMMDSIKIITRNKVNMVDQIVGKSDILQKAAEASRKTTRSKLKSSDENGGENDVMVKEENSSEKTIGNKDSNLSKKNGEKLDITLKKFDSNGVKANAKKTPEDKKVRQSFTKSMDKEPSLFSTKKIYEYFTSSASKVQCDLNDSCSESNDNDGSVPKIKGKRTLALDLSDIRPAKKLRNSKVGTYSGKLLSSHPSNSSRESSSMKVHHNQQDMKTPRKAHGKSSLRAQDSSSRKIYEYFSVQSSKPTPVESPFSGPSDDRVETDAKIVEEPVANKRIRAELNDSVDVKRKSRKSTRLSCVSTNVPDAPPPPQPDAPPPPRSDRSMRRRSAANHYLPFFMGDSSSDDDSSVDRARKMSSSDGDKLPSEIGSTDVVARSVHSNAGLPDAPAIKPSPIQPRVLRRSSVVRNFFPDENFSPNKSQEDKSCAGKSPASKRASRRLTLARKNLSLLM